MSKESKSPGWIREGPLWTYHRPLTASQRAEESAREYRELKECWREKIGPLVCPECGSDSIEEWTKGWWCDEEHYHDPNLKMCGKCGYEWFQPCPTCGAVDRRSPQEPTKHYCPKNPAKGHSHHMSDWTYWDPKSAPHPKCGDCGYIDKDRIL